jgi:indolepyruvate ferredoxin oxidoreductase alpha subunit
VEWSTNETVALELVQGASLCNQRSMAVMKHNGTNVVTDFLMHLNFTGVRGGLVLVSADDPGGNSSQNEEDTRISPPYVPAGLIRRTVRSRRWSRPH